MEYISIGTRRKKDGTTLDVTFQPIISDKNDIEQLKEQFSISKSGFIEISSKDYSNCRDTYFINLPSDYPKNNDYHQVDMILFYLSNIDASINSTEEAYFRLHLLSQRCLKPHDQCLDGLFPNLPNNAWTSIGPVLPEHVSHLQNKWTHNGHYFVVTHIDKFPYMLNYVVPSGVRVADASRVRLGAYLGHGTTIMPAGFVNFNAGTLGNAMVEGRISAGVIVGDDSDIGGGASIMGTLSGGNNVVISIGKKCLLGANAGTGISLGDGCTIAAGTYVYAGKKVSLFDENNNPVDINNNPVALGQNIVKAMELSGLNFRLYIEDSQTGELISKPNSKVIQLNEALHKN
ncbi:MAG: DapH/DapD/GlmU-related protein [Candidatus Margulisiibacteriota bacterium]